MTSPTVTPERGPAGGAAVADAAPPVLELRAVSKNYGAVRAVQGLSLEVRRGEILTLLGPSGCGKTTTLRMIIGLERCDSGEIVYDGRRLDAPQARVFVPTHKRQMGMVFQSYAIWPHMTVFDNVAYPLRVRGVGGERLSGPVMRALEQVGLAGLAQRMATQLSGGQQQRVALARSLVFEPQLLLLDEPFSNLDAQLRGQMRAELKVLQRRLGVTVVLVTHDQVEALSVSDRIALMRQGQVEQLGTPEALYREPATISVRDFVGHTMVLDGVVHATRAEALVVQLAEGVQVQASTTAPASLAPGDRCQVAIRPEHGHVEALDAASPAIGDADDDDDTSSLSSSSSSSSNALDGQIQAVLFVGDHYEATLALDIGQVVLAHLEPVDGWREGQRVRLRVRPRDVRVWSL